jgi:TonB family protein
MITVTMPFAVYGTNQESVLKEEPALVYFVKPQVEDAAIGMVVNVLLSLTEEGLIDTVELQNDGAPRFANSVAQAVKQWRFTPAIKNGSAVRCRVLVPFVVVPKRPHLSMRDN